MSRKIHQFTDPSDAFLITAPNYKTLYQSTLPAFLAIMDGMGHYDKKLEAFHIHGGGTVWCRTETDPDSIVGITNVRHIWGDEAGKYRLYFWENIQARADFCGATIDLTTSPYTLNWIFKELIKPYRDGKRPDVELIQAASWENKYHSLHDAEKRALKKGTMDLRRFQMIYGGEFMQMAGLVYDCFDIDENTCQPFTLPNGTRFVAGIDWGYTDPFVCVVRAIAPDGQHYQVSEFHKTGMAISDMIAYARLAKKTWGITTFFCDPSQPGYIEEFNRNRLGAIAADNDINRGVGLHYEMIKSRRYMIFEGTSPYTIDETETYHYPEPEDLGPDDDSKEPSPVDQNNHCLDANRYVTIETYRSNLRSSPRVPDEGRPVGQETDLERIRRLKRLKTSRNRHTENWSD